LFFNRSLEGIADRLRSDRLVDGVSLDNLNVEQTDSNNPTSQHKLALPGTAKHHKGNLSTNSTLINSEIMTYSLLFSLTGKEFAVVSTEGLQIYSLDSTMQFIPIELDLDISPENTRKLYHLGNYVSSLQMAIILNDKVLLIEIIEGISKESIEIISKQFNSKYLKEFLTFLTDQLVRQLVCCFLFFQFLVLTLFFCFIFPFFYFNRKSQKSLNFIFFGFFLFYNFMECFYKEMLLINWN
jgi:periodic tryptophan protein 2